MGVMQVKVRFESKRKWEATTLAARLMKASERKERFETSSGIEVERLYTAISSDNYTYHDTISL